MTDDRNAPRLPNVTRFLSEAIKLTLDNKIHTPEDLMEHFPPRAIMGEALKNDPAKRARLLTKVLGLPEKTSFSLPADAAGALLQNAYEAGDAPAEKIVKALTTDDMAFHFSSVALWSFIVNNEWWKNTKDERLRSYMASLIQAFWTCELIGPEDTLDLLGVTRLGRALPKSVLEQLFEDAAKSGLRGQLFEPGRIFKIVDPLTIVGCLDLEYVYRQLVESVAKKIRARAGRDRAGVEEGRGIMSGHESSHAACAFKSRPKRGPKHTGHTAPATRCRSTGYKSASGSGFVVHDDRGGHETRHSFVQTRSQTHH